MILESFIINCLDFLYDLMLYAANIVRICFDIPCSIATIFIRICSRYRFEFCTFHLFKVTVSVSRTIGLPVDQKIQKGWFRSDSR